MENMQETMLHLLRRYPQLTRPSLGRLLGAGSSAVSDAVTNLILKGLVQESIPFSSPRGRRPVGLILNGGYGLSIGIELTNINIKGVLIDFAGTILRQLQIRFDAIPDLESIINGIVSLTNELGNIAEIIKIPLLGCGLAVYGYVDPVAGVAFNLPFTDLHDMELVKIVQEHLNMPVIMETRMYAAGLAELNYGEGRQSESFVYINIDEGAAAFGSCSIDDNRVIRGHNLHAGQMAHLCVQPTGNRCYCGGRGCLTTVASPSVIVAHAWQEMQSGVQTELNRIVKENPDRKSAPLCFADILTAFYRHDKLATNLISEMAYYLGIGISYAVNLFAPKTVVLGGSLAESGNELVKIICHNVDMYTSPIVFRPEMVLLSEVDAAPALGAAILVADRAAAKKLLNYNTVNSQMNETALQKQ